MILPLLQVLSTRLQVLSAHFHMHSLKAVFMTRSHLVPPSFGRKPSKNMNLLLSLCFPYRNPQTDMVSASEWTHTSERKHVNVCAQYLQPRAWLDHTKLLHHSTLNAPVRIFNAIQR